MSNLWSWFVIVGTLGSLLVFLVFLFVNRKTSGEETSGHEWDGIQEFDNPLPFWWVGLFIFSMVFAVGYLIWYPGLGKFEGTAGWTSEQQWQAQTIAHEQRFAPLYAKLATMTPAELAGDRLATQVGRRLFINHCSTCHGVTAQGSTGFPDLQDNEWIWGAGFDNIKFAITNGRTAVMPALGKALGEQGVSDITQYLLAQTGREHGKTAAARGRDQYAIMCAVCHGPDGTGDPALGAPNLTDNVWLYGGTAKAIAHSLSNGRNGTMPGFSEVLDQQKIHILAGYVNGLSQ